MSPLLFPPQPHAPTISLLGLEMGKRSPLIMVGGAGTRGMLEQSDERSLPVSFTHHPGDCSNQMVYDNTNCQVHMTYGPGSERVKA